MNPIEERIAKVFLEAGIVDDEVTPAAAEQIVELCRIKGLTPEDVVLGKTPQGISALWMHRRMALRPVSSNDEPNDQRYPLLPFSRLVHDAIRHDKEAAQRWTFPVQLRAKETEIDAERLSAALETAISNHPVFAMHITEDGQQWYEKGYRTPHLSAKVYSEDGYVYLSLTLNRILGDATSFVLFAQNIWRAYRGEALPHDGYLRYLQQYEAHTKSHTYQEHGEWLAQLYGTPNYPLLPRQDSPTGELHPDTPYMPYIVTPDYADRLAAFCHQQKISLNAAFCLLTAIVIMDYNGTDKAGLTWAYMGRETNEQMHIFGSLHRDIPMIITKTMTKTGMMPSQLHTPPLGGARCGLCQLREQMEQGILHSDYPFTLSSPADSPWHNAVNVLVQPNLAEAMEGCPAEFEFIPGEPSNDSYCMLDIDITLEPLTLTFNYSPKHYTRESIQRFAKLIEKNAKMLLG